VCVCVCVVQKKFGSVGQAGIRIASPSRIVSPSLGVCACVFPPVVIILIYSDLIGLLRKWCTRLDLIVTVKLLVSFDPAITFTFRLVVLLSTEFRDVHRLVNTT